MVGPDDEDQGIDVENDADMVAVREDGRDGEARGKA